jgi:hypothetical protein
MNNRCAVVAVALLLAPAAPRAQQHSMRPGMTHEEHLAQMQREAETKKRGAAAMGFDQDHAAHHFLLTRAGGTIRVEATNATDTATRDAIRAHLRQVASEFGAGNFQAPFATHAETPPGAAAMQALKSSIRYVVGDRPGGGEVRIATSNENALAAVHEFLRYQIREHRTGDPIEIPDARPW